MIVTYSATAVEQHGEQGFSGSDRIRIYRQLAELFSLIPLSGKRPLESKWQQWCTSRRVFSESDFRRDDGTVLNAGIACGPARGVLVLDVDNEEAASSALKSNGWELPETRCHMTGSNRPHYLYRYPEDGCLYGNKSLRNSGFDIRGSGGQVVAPGSIHPNTGKLYSIFRDIPLAPAPHWLLDLCRHTENPRKESGNSVSCGWDGNLNNLPISSTTRRLITQNIPRGERSEAVITVINALVWSNLSDAEICQVFDAYPIGEKYREKGSSRQRWLQAQIDDGRVYVSQRAGKPGKFGYGKGFGHKKNRSDTQTRHSGNTEGKDAKGTLSAAIKKWVLQEPGRFHVAALDREVGLKTRTQRNNRATILGRLLREGHIERITGMRGVYQRIDRQCDEIDIWGAECSEHPVSLPLGLHKLVKIMPRNIIVFAGEPNSGKTALLLATVHENLCRNGGMCSEPSKIHSQNPPSTSVPSNSIYYFSSEMGGSEFRERLSLFKSSPPGGWNFKAYERSGNFHHVIQPDAVNIIDYLEVHEDFYKIGGYLRQIHDCLRNGVALVALQKNRGAAWGLGGMRGLEKPRLYVTLEEGRSGEKIARIIKAKNYRSDNPNGKAKRFRLIDGHQPVDITEWGYGEATA